MLREAINLCLAVYRVTELFPQAEPLRLKLREASLNVIASVVFIEKNTHSLALAGQDSNSETTPLFSGEFEKQFGVLYACIDIAKNQKWVDERNFDILFRSYEELKRKLQRQQSVSKSLNESAPTKNQKPLQAQELSLVVEKEPSAHALNLRQKRLLMNIKEEGPAPPMDFFVKFSNVNSRTILRDIRKLETMRLIKRRGSTRNREYYAAG